MKLIFVSPTSDDLARLLKAWRFWFAGAIVGALLAAGLYVVTPPPYRARATVNVDFHLEQAWPQSTDREQFYYLERETRKLEAIAMSDSVLAGVAAAKPGVSMEQLRAGKLKLSQPGNGAWHFFADDRDSALAASLATTWASLFANQVQQDVVAASSAGLEPFITAAPTEAKDLAPARTVAMGVYLIAGAVLALTLGAFLFLFFAPGR